ATGLSGWWYDGRHPPVGTARRGMAIHDQPVERGDPAIVRPGTRERRIGVAEDANIVWHPGSRIDHGDVGTSRDEVLRNPMPYRPFPGRGRIEPRAPELALQCPHRIEARRPGDAGVVHHGK